MDDILRRLQQEERYQANQHWGKPRFGHPEGSLAAHIAQLEANLDRLRPFLVDQEEARLRLLIHVHDICKPEARSGVPSSHPDNHALMARHYLAQFCQEPALLAITQHHDDGFLLFSYHRYDADLTERIEFVLEQVVDVELFLLFTLVDGCTEGKLLHPVEWLLQQVGLQRSLPERISAAFDVLRRELNQGA